MSAKKLLMSREERIVYEKFVSPTPWMPPVHSEGRQTESALCALLVLTF
jgi:hypothetical protein